MSEERKVLHFIAPVEEIPSKRGLKVTIYSEILREFKESNLKYAEVKLTHPELKEAKPVTIAYQLRRKLKQEKTDTIKVRFINKKVYLEKLE